MSSLLLSLIVYFDSTCKVPGIRVDDYEKVRVKIVRQVNVVGYYKKVDGECVRFIGDENLYWISL